MAKHIALAGKGGTGKTTLAALAIRYLVEKQKGKVLAVDADPNSTLDVALGLEVPHTVSEIVEDAKTVNFENGDDNKTKYLERRFYQEVLMKLDGYDFFAMGGPREAGCYCFPTAVLARNIESLEGDYDYMVIDNEAGLEHISRGTIKDIDMMLAVADGSSKGVRTAGRIYRLAKSLGIGVAEAYLVITKTDDVTELGSEIEGTDMQFLGTIPYDQQLTDFDLTGKPLQALPADNPAVRAAYAMFERIFP
jgi:CO dehydrogenase maturation factor